jgi:N utilization substance protein B
MRIALIEMIHADAVPADDPIPPEGAIDEAVESAKLFCSAEAPAFVNGILGAILRDLRENPAVGDPAEPAGASQA